MKIFKRFFALILVMNFLINFVPTCAETENEISNIVSSSLSYSYGDYIEEYTNANYPKTKIEIFGNTGIPDEKAEISVDEYEGKNMCLIWKNGEGKVSFPVNIVEEGCYCIGVTYYSISGKGTSLEYSVSLDGEIPFSECASVSFPRYYKYAVEPFLKDTNDNELRSEHVDVPMWNFASISDETGVYSEPYSFYFSEGYHTITLESLRDGIVIYSLCLFQVEEQISYSDYLQVNPGNNIDGQCLIIEAEYPTLKTSPVLYPISNRSDPSVSASDPVKTRLNTIGGDNWTSCSQSIIWDFTVSESGYYKLGFHYKQNYLRGMSTYREIMIDGKIPFAEFQSVAFPYNSSFEMLKIDDYSVFLAAGEHTITLTPTLSITADIIKNTNGCIEKLNEAYGQIISITGTSPDMWRNYYLHEAIPGLKDTFKEVYDDLTNISDEMFKLTGTHGSEASIIDRICKQLNKFIKSQDSIAEQLESYHSNISSLSSWVLDLQAQKLSLDSLYIVPVEAEYPSVDVSFFEKLIFYFRSFVGAFTEDYSSIGNIYEGGNRQITVWTASGRDQADIIKEIVDSEFVSKTGIGVNLQLVQGNLEMAVLSGRGPDVSVGAVSPVSLALRDAVVPLDEFSDFEEVVKKYPLTMLNPFSIKGHCFALPESVNFNMMFYRTDVFERLNITPPKTWDEFYDVTEILQRNNMNVGLPSDLFQILTLQMGGKIYNSSLTSTELTTPIAYKAFKMWTDFYSQYGAPIVKDDYNRFRTGELPLTIITYDFYMKLYASAPEIRNLWAMTTIPHFKDGESTSLIYETSACIFNSVDDKEAAWEFLKWWTSTETQQKYSRKLESVFGVAGRFSPANPEAYSQVAWSGNELKVLQEQLNQSVALPTVPGDYYVLRNITNAFEAVLYNNKNPREALKYWMSQTNSEMARRSEEFGVGDENTHYE